MLFGALDRALLCGLVISGRVVPDRSRQLILHHPGGLEVCRSTKPIVEWAFATLALTFALYEDGAEFDDSAQPIFLGDHTVTGSLDQFLFTGGTCRLHRDGRGRTVLELFALNAKRPRIYHGVSIIDVLTHAKHHPRICA